MDSWRIFDPKWRMTVLGISSCLSAILYYIFLYQTPRTAFLSLIGQFWALFFLSFLLWQVSKKIDQKRAARIIIVLGISFRLIVTFALPNLSDDYYRFVWDGRLLDQGIDPFAQIPKSYMETPEEAEALGLSKELFEGLNSPAYFTIYPPVNQFIFWLGAIMFPRDIYASVIVMKFCILLAEVGTLFLLLSLLKCFGFPLSNLAIYALNPLVIVELCGNLHFEACMIFFLLLAIYVLVKGKWWQASLPFAMAVASKLLPIMFLPLLIRRLGFWRAVAFGGMVCLALILMFLPIMNLETLQNLFESIELYFQKFEFNASIYYIVRWFGYQVKGYNIIAKAGTILPMIVVGGILLLTLFEKRPRVQSLPRSMMWALCIYFALASIVHPWYATTVLALSIFTPYRFALVWTIVLPLSYFPYQTPAYQENLFLVGIAYLCVYVFLGIEIFQGFKRTGNA